MLLSSQHKQQQQQPAGAAEVGKVQLTEPTLGKRDKDPFGHKSSLLAGSATGMMMMMVN